MRALRIGLVILGLAAAGYGLFGVFTESRPIGVGVFAAATVLGHDLLLAPAAALVATLARRLVAADLYPIVRGGLIVTGCVLAVSWPFVLGLGRRATNPSALPLNYPLGLALTLAAVWLVTAGLLAVRRRGRRRRTGKP